MLEKYIQPQIFCFNFVDWMSAKMDTSSSQSSTEAPTRTPLKGPELKGSPQLKGNPRLRGSPKPSPRRPLRFDKPTLNSSDSTSDKCSSSENSMREIERPCNGSLDSEHSECDRPQMKIRDAQSMCVQVGESLLADSEKGRSTKELSPKHVNVAAQVGESLRMMGNDSESQQNSDPNMTVRTKETNGQGVSSSDKQIDSVDKSSSASSLQSNNSLPEKNKRRSRDRLSLSARKRQKESSSDGPTPLIETQAQRVPGSNSTQEDRSELKSSDSSTKPTTTENVKSQASNNDDTVDALPSVSVLHCSGCFIFYK